MAKDRTSNGSKAFHDVLHTNHQAHGALGVVNVVAQIIGMAAAADGDSSQLRSALITGLGADPSPVGAISLAALAELSITSDQRAVAGRLLADRRHQVSGLARTLGDTTVGSAIAISDEYRDDDVVCVELLVGGSRPVTLVGEHDRVWVRRESSVEVFNCSVADAARRIEFEDRPGSPRREERPLAGVELRRALWWFAQDDAPAEGSEIGWCYLQWMVRLLEIDTTWSGLPTLARNKDVDEDELIESFRASQFGRDWSRWAYDELIDHVVYYDLDGDVPPLCWSPSRVAHVLTSRVGFFDGEHAAALPAFLRSWVKFCADNTGQRKALLKPVLAEIDVCSPDFYRTLGERGAA